MYHTLIIGSGKRIKNNFLPALNCLKNHFQIIGIHSRTEINRNVVAKKWDIPNIGDLHELDFSNINLVVMSITLANNKQVLQKLFPYASNIILVIDTPVLPIYDLTGLKLLKQFKKVVVTEDFMNFPQFHFMREFIKSNHIGKLQKITLDKSGYRYHGLALIRSFLNFEKIIYSRQISSNSRNVSLNYHFKNGIQGSVMEPYKRLNGNIILVGSRGILTTEDIDSTSISNSGEVYKIKEVWQQNKFQGFMIEGKDFCKLEKNPFYDVLESLCEENNSHFNILKTCGLLQVFDSLLTKNLHSQYTMLDGLYDQVISSLARKYDPFFDFLGFTFRLKLYLDSLKS